MAAPSVPEIETIDPGSVTTSDAARRTTSARWKATAYSLLGAVSFLVVWQLASQYTRTEFDLLPGPLEVAEQMGVYIVGDEAEGIPPGWVFVNFWDTFRKTLYGFAGALILGVPIGILMGRYRYAKAFFFDFVYLAANVPLIVYAILGLLIFGIGDIGPAFVVGLLVLPVITLNVAAGVEGVDQNLLAMSRSFGFRPNRPCATSSCRRFRPSSSPGREPRSPRRGSWPPSPRPLAERPASVSRSARPSRDSPLPTCWPG